MVLVQVLISDSRSGCARASRVQQMSHLYYFNYKYFLSEYTDHGKKNVFEFLVLTSSVTEMLSIARPLDERLYSVSTI